MQLLQLITLIASSLRLWWENEFAIFVLAAPKAEPIFSDTPANEEDHPPICKRALQYIVNYFPDPIHKFYLVPIIYLLAWPLLLIITNLLMR